MTTALPGRWSQDPAPEGGDIWGAASAGMGSLSRHSSYLLGAAEHVTLRAGDTKLQQPLLLLKK